MTTTAQQSAWANFRRLGFMLVLAPVILGIAVAFVLPAGPKPTLTIAALLVILAAGAHVAAEAIGYKVRPLDPTLSGAALKREAILGFNQGLMRRFAVCDAVAILALILGFVLAPSSWWTYAIGGALSVALMVWHVLPSRRAIELTQRSLNAGGANVDLAAAMGVDA